MSVLNLETGELVSPLSADEARKLTERIRYTALSVRDGMEKLQRLVQEAQDGQAHVALGYASWTAYLADTLGKEPLRLPRDQRQELVGYLAGEGMSGRAIAAVVGADRRTVDRDLAESGGANAPRPQSPQGEARDSHRGAQTSSPSAEEAVPVQAAPRPADQPEPPKPITGMDGKEYKRPEPKPAPKATPRRALPDQFFDAAYDLTKAAERVERLTADDRFPQNAEKVGTKHRADLLRAVELLTKALDRFPS